MNIVGLGENTGTGSVFRSTNIDNIGIYQSLSGDDEKMLILEFNKFYIDYFLNLCFGCFVQKKGLKTNKNGAK